MTPSLHRRALACLACLLAAAGALALAGCGTGAEDRLTRAAEPLTLVRILPTRPGLVPGGPAAPADAQALAVALAGEPDADLERAMQAQGLERAAVRVWTGPAGRRMVVATSLWQERRGAVGFGGEAVDRLLDRRAATPWSPRGFGGSRGARVREGSDQVRALSFAVGRTGLFIRADGPVPDQTLLRTLDLLVKAAQGEDRESR
jgi:hypothetical protein